MKILFFLALLVNLVFFLWQYNAGAFHNAADKTEIASPEPKQIWLLSELAKKPAVSVAAIHTPTRVVTNLIAPATVISRPTKNNPQHLITSTIVNSVQISATSATPMTPVATVTAKTFYCYQVGGFADKAAVIHWAQQQALDETSLQLKETPPVIADYLVNYPAAATLADSKKNMAVLTTHGINDFFMINQGEFKGTISLGVFKNEARAIKAQQILIQKGINAKVSKRYKTAATVSAQIKTEKTRPQLLATLAGHAPQPRVELVSQCK
jgi:hypothetical protein